MTDRCAKELEILIKELDREYYSGQLFFSKYKETEGGSIESIPCGFGDIYARIGQVRTWLNRPSNKEIPNKIICLCDGMLKYYDTIQFFLSRKHNNKWQYISCGCGNIHSRIMQSEIWMDVAMNEYFTHGEQDDEL